jgi:hypothetical protein
VVVIFVSAYHHRRYKTLGAALHLKARSFAESITGSKTADDGVPSTRLKRMGGVATRVVCAPHVFEYIGLKDYHTL